MIGLLLAGLSEASIAAGFAHVAIVDPSTGVIFDDTQAAASWNYPKEALEQRMSGSVGVRLGLGADGAVNRCAVISSSGSKSLDEDSCDYFETTVVATTDGTKLPFTVDARMDWTLPPADHPSRARIDADIFHDDDYPKDAIVDDAEGITGVELKLATGGAVTACRVTESSGNAALDAKTCEVFIERGRAYMVGSSAKLPATMDKRVRWVLPEGVYFGNSVQQLSIRADKRDGRPVCTDLTYGQSDQLDPDECMEMLAILALLKKDSQPVESGEATFSQGLALGNDLAAVEAGMVGTILMRGAVRLTVADNGRVASCEEVKATEWKRAANAAEPPQGCAQVQAMRFERRDERRSEQPTDPIAAPEGLRKGIMYWFVTYADRVSDG